MFPWQERREYKIPCEEGEMFLFQREKGKFSLLEGGGGDDSLAVEQRVRYL